MVLQDFALLAADTARTKAYLYAMIQENKLPGVCVVYSDNIPRMQEEASEYQENLRADIKFFSIEMPVLSFIQKTGITCILVENKDINSDQMKETIKSLQQKYLIYSGYGGYILHPHLFQIDKRFVHVHAGILPRYRGSTTVYYSYLQEKMFGATAIFLNEGIDEGEIIVSDTFEVPEMVIDIDYIYDSYIRSKVLMNMIDKYLLEGGFTTCRQSSKDSETYFIIHPVLKHIALLGIKKEQGNKKNDGDKYEDGSIYTTCRDN